MKMIGKTLRSQVGESIAETLVAVLVIAVALTMLAAMISATTSIVKTSEEKMDDYYKANAALETLDTNVEPLTISIKEGDAEVQSISVVSVTNEVLSKPVIAYRYNKG